MSNVAVVVVASQHCPACMEYKPRFVRIAQQFSGRVPAHIVDLEQDGAEAFADRYSINALPTTLILRRPTGAIRAEGTLSDAEIQRLFEQAALHA